MRGGGWIPIVIAAVSLAFTAYTYIEGKKKAKEAEDKNDLRMDRQEAKAKLNTDKQYYQTIAFYNKASMIAKKDLLEAKRERQAGLRNYGAPTRS